MKKLLLSLLCWGACIVFVQAQDSVFYYNEFGGKIYLQKDNTKKIIHFANETAVQNNLLFNQLNAQNITIDTLSGLMYKIMGNLQQNAISNLLLPEQIDSNVLYVSDMLLYGGSTLWESDGIIVKIFPDMELPDLLEVNHIPYKEFKRLGSNPQTYLIKLDVSEYSAIEYANWLVENNLVVIAQPSFWISMPALSNPYYSSQWGMKNTGQYDGIVGVDIKAVYAWELADGSDIKVAVIDRGVDLTHPDLIDNLLPGYDATDGNDAAGATNGGYGGSYNDDSHGMACAGIIAARDNNVGIKGIAYNAKIIPIRHSYSKTEHNSYTNEECTVNAIEWAWKNGADVLSCSWKWVIPNFAITAEIDSAVTHGRGGKGCVVVFGAGNDNNSTVSYPASLPSVISVGAISPCGERKRSSNSLSVYVRARGIQSDPAGVSCDGEENWGSNYGQDLDVVAPGVLVPTTDIQGNSGYNPNDHSHTAMGGSKITSDFSNQDYTVCFGGTSAACPHVAGVAALVLSVDPTLTGEQVRNIIKSTAQKIRPDLYNYNTSDRAPYALWHQEVGYGLVDAYAAVQAAKCTKPLDLMIGDTPDDAGIEPNPSPNGDILDCSNIWVGHTNSTIRQYVKYGEYNESNKVYVRIRNIGCQPHNSGEAKISLYWAKKGMNLNLQESWHHIRTDIITSISANGEIIEEFPWLYDKIPNPANYSSIIYSDSCQFYLLAKISSINDPLSFPETSDFESNVRNNNNIACRSIRVGSGVDLMIKDTETDTGDEPNTTTDKVIWDSPDIWIRNSFPDYLTEHQNPIRNCTNYVHVRVKNIGKMPSFGNEKLNLYWSQASLHSGTNWTNIHYNGILIADIIGTYPVSNIRPNTDTIIIIPWYVSDPQYFEGIADEPFHFCLLARIESSDDILKYPNETTMRGHVEKNNNIAWKNVTVVKGKSLGGAVYIWNTELIQQIFKLQFLDDGIMNNGKRIFEEAEIKIKMNKVLYDAWERGGKIGTNISLVGERTIRITGENAILNNLIFEPNEFGMLHVSFNFLIEGYTATEGYSTYNVILSSSVADDGTENTIGGEVYYIYRSPRLPFTANAGEDIYADRGETVVLSAEDVGEEAIYKWYSENGEFLHEGMEFVVEVTAAKKYTLEVTALSDGYKAYDVVEIKLNSSAINIDLMIRDIIDDTGETPTNSFCMWDSPDIWVRNFPDYGTEHQNPIAAHENFIYVRITNRGNDPSLGNEELKLYWSKASATFTGSADWTEFIWADDSWTGDYYNSEGLLIGGMLEVYGIPPISPGEEIIMEIPWEVPNPFDDTGETDDNSCHFSLLARIEAESDSMNWDETNDIMNIVNMGMHNNNIAWKNVAVIDASIGSTKGIVSIGNPYPEPHTFNLLFMDDGSTINGKRIYEEAEINIELDDILYDVWERGGKIGTNISFVGERTIRITGENAILNNLIFEPNEFGMLHVSFNFLIEGYTATEGYSTYNVILSSGVADDWTENIIGGETYHVYRSPRTPFTANAGEDIYTDVGVTVVLIAEYVGEEAIYRWYDQGGTLLYEGIDFSVEAIENKKYILEVTAVSDGFKDYDEVMVKVDPNSILTIFPNPTNGQITISYDIEYGCSEVYIIIRRNIAPFHAIIFQANQFPDPDNITLNIAGFPEGFYIVTLLCDGYIENKTFVKY